MNETTTFSTRQRVVLLGIVLVYLGLGVLYMLATPPLEASDEYKHYPVVQYIQTHRALPVLDPKNPGRWLQEAAQPPLYYLLMAAVTAPIDTGDLEELHQVNPHAFIGNPNQVQNKNLILHDPQREQFPWTGSVLAIYLIRLASLGLGMGALVLIAHLGRLLASRPLGLLAAALTAVNPMFLFVSAAVNNDSLAILLSHLGLLLLLKIWLQAPDPRAHWRRYATLGLVLGLAMLTKLSLGGLLALSGLALAWMAWRRHDARFLFLGGVIVAGVAAGVTGWWFVRNLAVYGDLTGLDVFIAVQGTRDGPLTWSDWIGEFGTFYRSFWGLFGGVNVAAPEFFYQVSNLLVLLGLAGWGVGLWKRRLKPRPGMVLALAWLAVMVVLLLRWTIIDSSFQGRLIFPALGVFNILWLLGLAGWGRERLGRWLQGGLVLWFLLAAVALPWISIRPAYAYPEPLASVPETARFGPITFHATDGELQLVGVELPAGQSVTPAGDPVELVLYWQATTPVAADYVSSVHLLGRNAGSVGQVNRYPGWGMIPTSAWQVGEIWRDTYHVRAARDAAAPTRLQVSVGLYDTAAGSSLPAFDPSGSPLDLVVAGSARLAQADPQPLQPAVETGVTFAEGITLAGYSLTPQPAAPGDQVTVALAWQASSAPVADYTVFVHLVAAGESTPLLTADGPPLDGDYPTGLWQAGDWVADEHTLPLPADLPPGDYTVVLGFYDPLSGMRLARLDGQGDSVSLPLRVEAR